MKWCQCLMLCVLVLLVFVGALVAKKKWTLYTYWFVQMVVLFRVQVVLEVLEVLVAAWTRQVCSVCR